MAVRLVRATGGATSYASQAGLVVSEPVAYRRVFRPMAKTKPILIRQQRREGEGALVSVLRRNVAEPDGSSLVELGFDLGEAPVPQRRYHAKVVGVAVDNGSVSVFFGQPKIGGGLRSLIEVSMTTDAVRQFLKTCETFYPIVTAFVERNEIEQGSLTEIVEEPSQTVAMVVNVVAACQTGREVVLDMYHVSAFSLRDSRNSDKMALDPIVRIDLSVSLTVALLDRLSELEQSFPRDPR